MAITTQFLTKSLIFSSLFLPSLVFGDFINSIDQESKLHEIREMFEKIESKLNLLKSKKRKVKKTKPTSVETKSLKTVSARDVLAMNRDIKKRVVKKMPLVRSTKGSDLKGFYFLPFVGTQSSTDIVWDTWANQVEIDLNNGLSTGLRVGYNWYDLFAEFQFSYQKNDIKGINQNAVNINGEIDGLGFYLSSGGRINFNESISALVGIGVGGINQHLNFSLSGIPFDQKKFLFSSNVFLGVEYSPIDHLILGLRYRWVLIDDMNSFSKRYLNSVELTAGYLF